MSKVRIKRTFLILLVFVFSTCRREINERYLLPESLDEGTFFSRNLSHDPKIQSVFEYVKRQNNTCKFVEKIVERIGYPIWNKTLVTTKSANNQRGGDEEIYYIPFVRDGEVQVNASLVIQMSDEDTSGRYIYDYEYSKKAYRPNYTDTTAEYLASFFLILDNHVFGYDKFEITDSLLFRNNHSYDTGYRELTINTLQNQDGRSFGTTINFEFIVCGTPNQLPCSESCDYQNCASDPDVCYIINGWIDFDDPPETGGGSGSSGSGSGGEPGGGGSGGPSGWEPDPDPCGPQARLLTNCGSGYIPIGGGNSPSPPNDSTIAQNLKRLLLKAKTKMDSLHSVAQNDGDERTFTFVRSSHDTLAMWIRLGNSHSSMPTLSAGAMFIFHTHQEDDFINGNYKNQCLDGPDMYKLYKNRCIDGYPLEGQFITTRDYYYAVYITDADKFKTYVRTLCGTMNIWLIDDCLDAKHQEGMANCNACNYQAQTEKGIMNITANNNASVSGLRVFRSPRNNVNFTLLTP